MAKRKQPNRRQPDPPKFRRFKVVNELGSGKVVKTVTEAESPTQTLTVSPLPINPGQSRETSSGTQTAQRVTVFVTLQGTPDVVRTASRDVTGTNRWLTAVDVSIKNSQATFTCADLSTTPPTVCTGVPVPLQ